ncbi:MULTISPECIES: hypothetical protein [unclassified Sphingomonas]|uniref:hypothetical protein n=1 Tax=unclassified Sphingomonas TaxID=196159 RepID=UPI00226A9B16|nr:MULTISPECIES: hypothetical protein [unclassified Sphingomonas]
MLLPLPSLSAPHRITDRADLERLAVEFAAMTPGAAEELIDSLAAQAIARWRLDDATMWQRVKFRARMIRATARSLPGEPARARPAPAAKEN